MIIPRTDHHWNNGDLYERYIGRWSQRVAEKFLVWLDLPHALQWLEIGCGTGALTAAIRTRCRPALLIGCEPSAGFLRTAQARLEEAAAFCQGSALAVPLRDSTADVVVSGLVLNFIPNLALSLAEMRRVTANGGFIAAYVWDYAGKMELIRYFFDAAIELDPTMREHDEGSRFPICQPEALERAFREAHLSEVRVAPIEIPMRFRDFEDYWSPFLSGQGPAPAYAMSLDEGRRSRLRDLIRSRLPVDPDGSIPLVARAWTIRGRVLHGS